MKKIEPRGHVLSQGTNEIETGSYRICDPSEGSDKPACSRGTEPSLVVYIK